MTLTRFYIKYHLDGKVYNTYVIAPNEECAKDSIVGEVIDCWPVSW